MNTFQCNICLQSFSQRRNLYRHSRNVHNDFGEEKRVIGDWKPFNFTRDVAENMYLCPTCHVPFLSKKERDAHHARHKIVKVYNCKRCIKAFSIALKKRLHEKFCLREANDEE